MIIKGLVLETRRLYSWLAPKIILHDTRRVDLIPVDQRNTKTLNHQLLIPSIFNLKSSQWTKAL